MQNWGSFTPFYLITSTKYSIEKNISNQIYFNKNLKVELIGIMQLLCNHVFEKNECKHSLTYDNAPSIFSNGFMLLGNGTFTKDAGESKICTRVKR